MAQDRNTTARRYRTFYPPPDPLPAHALLGDLDDWLARILWRAARDVADWSAAAPEVRESRGESTEAAASYRECLAYAMNQTPELDEALGAFGVLRLSPRLAQLSHVARACEQVYEWAERCVMHETALLFAETWARVDPDNPIASNAAGRAARRTAHVQRAEVWFDRAYKLAARFKNRREKIRALIGHGGLLRELGRHAEARKLFLDAARLAESTRRHRQAAEVQHELLTIAAETGSYQEAEHYMRAALREYPVHHRAMPWLAHDWAFFLVRLSLYEEARVLLEAIRPHIARRDLQVVVEGTLGRTLAACGHREAYEECVRRVLALSAVHEEYAAAALAHLAVGAQFFQDWDAGERMAERAVEIARARRQADVERGASEILSAIQQRKSPSRQADPPDPNRLAIIQRQMLARLRERSKPRRRQVVEDPEAGGRPAGPPAEGQPTGPRIHPGTA
jgi:tetratricopeptide (TPR) repeat protein